MTTLTFLFAVLALLLAPGPTNTLIGIAGAQRGLSRVVGLLPAELAGYLTAILPLAVIGAQLLDGFPQVAVVLKLAAALWVMVLAVRLWHAGGGGDAAGAITPWRIYLTTALNPKALIIGLVLLPPLQDAAFLPRLGLFALLVVGVALLWGGAGALTRTAAGGSVWVQRLHRVASAWLVLISLSLVLGAVQA